MEKNPRKRIKPLIVSIILVVVFLVSGTYAWFTLLKRQEHSNVVLGKCLDIEMSNASDSTSFVLENAFPMTIETVNDLEGYTFSVTNKCDEKQHYVIGLEDVTTADNKFSYSSISVALDGIIIGALSTTDDIDDIADLDKVLKKIGYGTVEANSTNTHELKLWVNETSPSSEIGYTFNSKLFVVSGQYTNGKFIENEGSILKGTLAAMMKENADTETAIDFNVQSSVSGTNGIYMTTNTDSGLPVYYYRGQVDNNLIFGGFCWQIIRTTETGGIKIIYSGTPSASGACNSATRNIGLTPFNVDGTDNTFAGYMTGEVGASTYAEIHSNLYDSNIKTVIDNWYLDNILKKGLSIYLEDTVYCNNRNILENFENVKYTDNYRFDLSSFYSWRSNIGYQSSTQSSLYTINTNPSLVCNNTTEYVPENNDSFTVSSSIGNGKLIYPIGLITTDEAVYAGFDTQAGVAIYDENYLNCSTGFYTMTPILGQYGRTLFGSIDQRISITWNNNNSGVRPVISLRPDTKIVSGTGTKGNPFIAG